VAHSAEAIFQRLQLPLLDMIQSHPRGLSEYALLALLAESDDPSFEREALRQQLSLFQSHFLLFHLLYRLRDWLWSEQLGHLEIDCLKIALADYAPVAGTLPGSCDPLRDYYLNLDHLSETSDEDVAELLEGFWLRYAGHDQSSEALAVLGLDVEADAAAIKQRYLKLAMEHHPDRGGDSETLQRINAAMTVLRQR